jgi:hypothetical protein
VALQKVGAIGINYYFHPLFEKTKIPVRGCENFPIAAAPLIHGYTVNPLNFSRFALKKDMPVFEFNQPGYNGEQEFSERCPTAIYINNQNVCEGERQNQRVWAHDETLSPKISVPKLKKLIESAVENSQDLFATSYVISHTKKEVYITSHCLLKQQSHDALFNMLDSLGEGLTLQSVIDRESPIQQQLQDFQTGACVRPEHLASMCMSPQITQSQIAGIIANYQSNTWYGRFLSIFGIKHMSKTMIALDNYVKNKKSSDEITLVELQNAIQTQNDDSRKMHRVGLFNNTEESDNSGTDSIIEEIKGLYKLK